MYCARSARSITKCACAVVLMALLGCAGCANTQSQPRPAPRSLVSSPAMGLVGLLVMDPMAGPPRAAGMHGLIVGYVTSHPALESNLSVRQDGRALPILAFRMNFVVVQADGVGGLEDTRGRGKLEVFYNVDGFNDAVLNEPRTLDNAQLIEADDVEFRGSIDFDTYRFYMRVHETAMASRPFRYAGREWRTPILRSSWDVLIGEYSDSFVGVAFASNNTMHPLSPQEKLVALVGPRPSPTRY